MLEVRLEVDPYCWRVYELLKLEEIGKKSSSASRVWRVSKKNDQNGRQFALREKKNHEPKRGDHVDVLHRLNPEFSDSVRGRLNPEFSDSFQHPGIIKYFGWGYLDQVLRYLHS